MPKPTLRSTFYPGIRNGLILIPPFDASQDIDLVLGPVTVTPETDWAAVTVASFPGYATKTSDLPFIAFDVTRQQWEVKFPEPLGGWTWTRTAGAGDPQQIGAVKVWNMGGFAISSAIITAAGDSVTIPEIWFPLKDLVIAL